MAKKQKKTEVVDDIIGSLMEDLKVADLSELDVTRGGDHFADSEGEVVGLAPEDFRVEDGSKEQQSIWGSITQAPEHKLPPPPEDSFLGKIPVAENSIQLSESSHVSSVSSEVKNLPSLEGQALTGSHNINASQFEDLFGLSPEKPVITKEFDFGSGSDNLKDDDIFSGPSVDAGYQSVEEIFSGYQAQDSNEGSQYEEYSASSDDEKTRPIGFESDSTRPALGGVGNNTSSVAFGEDADKTLAANDFSRFAKVKKPQFDEKIGIGSLKSSQLKPGAVFTNADASLIQAENLKIAQNRILELEKEVERLRGENEELASAAEIIKTRSDESLIRLGKMEKERVEIEESHKAELLVLKGNLQYKEAEVAKARLKVEELETRLKNDFKKIRVKERELENRLELAKAEKAALVRSKDEYILDLKRKIDQLQGELDNYRGKVLELNRTLDSNQEQFKRTVRALRLALTNLELRDGESNSLKKAE